MTNTFLAQLTAAEENGGALMPRATEPMLVEKAAAPGLPPAVDFTDYGKRVLVLLRYNGLSQEKAAAFFGMSREWLQKKIKNYPELRTLWDQGDAMAELELKAAGMEMAKTNPAQNQWERKTRFGEGEVKDKTINHKHYVVGMLPENELTLDGWLEKFGPEGAKDDDNQH